MKCTPNDALQRTRAASLLQCVPGEIATVGRRRAPLSFETLGPLGFIVASARI